MFSRLVLKVQESGKYAPILGSGLHLCKEDFRDALSLVRVCLLFDLGIIDSLS